MWSWFGTICFHLMQFCDSVSDNCIFHLPCILNWGLNDALPAQFLQINEQQARIGGWKTKIKENNYQWTLLYNFFKNIQWSVPSWNCICLYNCSTWNSPSGANFRKCFIQLLSGTFITYYIFHFTPTINITHKRKPSVACLHHLSTWLIADATILECKRASAYLEATLAV